MVKLSSNYFKKLPACQKRMTASTLLTIVRILLIPVIVGSMIFGQWGLAFWLFVFAALTDVLDGFFARLLNQQTFLGACLDPVADKFLILSVFFTIAFIKTPLFALPQWFVFLVLFKEFVQIGGACMIYLLKGHLVVRPTILGKLSMAMQTLFIIWLFACYFFNWLPIKTYYVMLGTLLFLVLASLIQYVRIGFEQLREV